jgi:ATP-binding cassette subfamily B protein
MHDENDLIRRPLAPVTAALNKSRKWRARGAHLLKTVARFRPYLHRRLGRLFQALILALLYMAMGLIEPWPLKLVLDNVILSQPLPSFLQPVLGPLGGDRLLLLNVFVGALVLIVAARGFFYYRQHVMTARIGQQIVADIRLDLYSHLQHLPFSFHDRRRTGDLIMRLTSDIGMLRDVMVSAPLSVTSDLLLVLGMLVIMFLMNWQLTLIALAMLPILGLLLRNYHGPLKRASRKQRKREGQLASKASEVLGAIRVVQGFRRERYEIERFSAANKDSLRSDMKTTGLGAKFRWSSEVAVAIVTGLLLTVAVRAILSGALSPGDLIVFVAYLEAFTRPLRRLSRVAQRSARTTAAGERVVELLETKPTVQDLPEAMDAPRFRGAIAYENVSFAHQDASLVLAGIDLQIEAGERVAIVGPTGAGKTTLVNLLPRFYDPTEGRVCIDGLDVRQLTLASVREQISFVFQDPVLFATTVAENIAYGKPDASRGEVVEAAKLAGIHPIIASLRDGYDTLIGERGGTLSGGQRQCVTIARAFIKDAPIVVLDEPTTGLDSESAALVLQALHCLMEGRTVVMISHQLHTARDADRVVVLEGGRIVEHGSHATLLARRGLYHRLQVLQAGVAAS